MLILRVFKELIHLVVKLYDRDKGLLDGDDNLADLRIDRNDLIDKCLYNPGKWQLNKEF